jgi:membrane protein
MPAAAESTGARTLWDVVTQAASDFVENDALTHAAALAYYTALGMSPLIVLLLWLATFSGEGTRQELIAQIAALVGPEGGQAIRAVVENAESNASLGSFAGIASLAMLLFSVSSVFGQLQYALNQLWSVKPAPSQSAMWPWIRKRLLSLGTFVSTGFLLVVSLSVSAAVAVASRQARDILPGTDLVWEMVTFGLSLAVTALVFGVIFRVLPDVKLGWRDVATGAVVTAVLFTIGRVLIGLYLGQSSIGSAYGAAGSLVVLLVWIYYAALVIFFGAVVTRVLARRRHARIEPEEHAIKVERKEVPKGKSARV